MNSLASLTPTSSNGEKRNVIEARLTYNVNRCPYCKSEKVVRNGSKILHTRLTELHHERFEIKLYKQRYLCKECLKTWSARTDIVEEGHTFASAEAKRPAYGTGGKHCDRHRQNLSLFAFKRHQNN